MWPPQDNANDVVSCVTASAAGMIGITQTKSRAHITLVGSLTGWLPCLSRVAGAQSLLAEILFFLFQPHLTLH